MALFNQPLHSRGLGGVIVKKIVLTIFAAEHLEIEYAS